MRSFLLLIACVSTLCGFSQIITGKITGTIVDDHKKPVEFATVTLHRQSDSILIKGSLSDAVGFFEIEAIAEGTYFLKIYSVTYATVTGSTFQISKENSLANAQDFVLKPRANALNEVTINAEKQFIERKLDRIVVNVENSIVAAGNNVLEVLQRSPGVVVNQESSINLKGKSGVIVMIDGKPSPLSGTDLITYLKSIPAADIQTIEIISNPSAKYDAAGNAGIINIKFKKDQRQGVNGSATASYGQGFYEKPSASATFNVREKKLNVFGSYSYLRPKNYTSFFINRKFFDQNQNLNSTFEQESFTTQPFAAHNSRMGLDVYANRRTVVGVLLNGNWSTSGRNGHTDATITNANGLLDYTTKTKILLDDQKFNGFGNINFKHSFDSTGKELTADLDIGSYDSKTTQDIRNNNFLPDGTILTDTRLATDQTGTIDVKSIKADYVHPFSENTKLEAGVKSSRVTSDNDVKFYDVVSEERFLDTSRSNHFIYTENIHAAYVSFSTGFTKWDVQGGLRIENTSTKGEQLVTGASFARNYVNFFPNLVVNRKFSEKNSLSLSYAKRIDRPSYRQLNPFKIFVDSYTYVVGDPTLKPVITDVYELNHTFQGKYVTTLSYTRARQSITDIFVQDDLSKISYQTPANIQNFEQYNLGIYIPVKVKKILNSTLAASVYRNEYASPLQGGNLQQSFTSWDMSLNNVFTLGTKGWSAELNGFYQSKMVWGLFYIKDLAQISVGVQKITRDKKSTFKLSVSDLFYTNHIAVEVEYQNQDFYTDRRWDSRVATLAYTYRFGKSTVARARQRSSGVEDEKRRAG